MGREEIGASRGDKAGQRGLLGVAMQDVCAIQGYPVSGSSSLGTRGISASGLPWRTGSRRITSLEASLGYPFGGVEIAHQLRGHTARRD